MQSDTERRMPLTPSRISWRGPFFPSILHQDLGYYQLPHGGFLKRAGHVWAEFSSHAPIPATQLTYSELVGGVSAAAISAYTYHPDSERSARNVIWGTQKWPGTQLPI